MGRPRLFTPLCRPPLALAGLVTALATLALGTSAASAAYVNPALGGALDMQPPAPRRHLHAVGKDPPPVNRHDVLGGLIHEYQIAA